MREPWLSSAVCVRRLILESGLRCETYERRLTLGPDETFIHEGHTHFPIAT